ncbi:MAG: hypothetical protein ACTSO7_10505 [Candidatus Heimdallarchaeota archaeon]
MSEFIFCNACGGQNEKGSENCSTCGEKLVHLERFTEEKSSKFPIENVEKNSIDIEKSNARKNWRLVSIGSILTIPIVIVFAFVTAAPHAICLFANFFLIIIAIFSLIKYEREKKHYFLLALSIISLVITITFLVLTIVFWGSNVSFIL